ncbi:S-Ena type endospore appendage [Rossellomorea marisflavi]|uniref:S-Ena type endospore appendage n=1 Tax=Rossellomorea marisflavi TaxID=189381 RepID=UPI001EE2DF62|nr:S-Ena type endospore appendage [Rossellomorea marisflavi]UKS67243.1 hypothetical protein K6T23_10620 [Rossellomorea marisflavi]
MDCFSKPLGKDVKCPQRPKRECKDAHFENCAPISGSGNRDVNVIFDVDPNSLHVTAAGTIENFSDQSFNVRFERENSAPIIILVAPHSSITFVYDNLIRITTTGTAPERTYNGSLKIQLHYTFERVCKKY